MRGKIAAYLVSVVLITAILSAYAGMSLTPPRTSVQTITTLEPPTIQQITNTVNQSVTVTFEHPPGTVVITSQGPGVTSTTTLSGTPSTTTVTQYYCGAGTTVMKVNGSSYCAVDVSSDTVVGNPGFSYFVNGSVTFMGVRFQTYCPPNYSGCPVPPNYTTTTQTLTTVSIGDMRFNMTFPDGKVEVAGNVIGDSSSVLMLSRHVNPMAGMLIQAKPYGYSVFLLVRYA